MTSLCRFQCIPTYYVSKIARDQVTVALGGDGGDENFAGYRRYVFDRVENRLRTFVPPSVRRTVFGPLGRVYPALAWAPRPLRAKATFQSLSRSPIEGYFNSVSVFRADEKPRLFTEDFRQQLRATTQSKFSGNITTQPIPLILSPAFSMLTSRLIFRTIS